MVMDNTCPAWLRKLSPLLEQLPRESARSLETQQNYLTTVDRGNLLGLSQKLHGPFDNEDLKMLCYLEDNLRCYILSAWQKGKLSLRCRGLLAKLQSAVLEEHVRYQTTCYIEVEERRHHQIFTRKSNPPEKGSKLIERLQWAIYFRSAREKREAHSANGKISILSIDSLPPESPEYSHECPICLNRFTNPGESGSDLTVPVQLPCKGGHFTCYDCIYANINRHGRHTCPCCRETIVYPPKEQVARQDVVIHDIDSFQIWAQVEGFPGPVGNGQIIAGPHPFITILAGSDYAP